MPAELPAAGGQPRRHLGWACGPRVMRTAPPLAHLPAEAAERHRMEVKGPCELQVLQREHLGQLGDDDPFGAPVVTA